MQVRGKEKEKKDILDSSPRSFCTNISDLHQMIKPISIDPKNDTSSSTLVQSVYCLEMDIRGDLDHFNSM